ncbi:type II/IV secretion system ATPase subunit [Geoglobus acetivorans]|uniref:Flagella-related protein FlaI n=1 Tax=Geoglobus acetivorans TaxID=565033 RepID=A0A0A7GDX8_GEOAI|nr:Flagella-related protein FlaI [Geoglobus acetivorans]
MFTLSTKYYPLLKKHLLEYVSEEEIIEDLGEEAQGVIREGYWIFRPFVAAEIILDRDTNKLKYNTMEPTLNPDEFQLLERIYFELTNILVLKDVVTDLFQKEKILLSAFNEVVDEFAVELDPVLRLKYLYYLYRDFIGFGQIDPLVNDPYIEDISCDGYNIPVYVYHKRYGNIPTNIIFGDVELDRTVQSLVQMSGKHISYGNPIIDATLPDGSRLQATYGTEITPRGSSFTIRKFTEEPLTPIDLIRFGTYTYEQMAYFWLAIENKLNILVVGETAAGKTTTLNAILMFLPPDVKVVSIEDTREIVLYHENWIAGVTREVTTGDENVISMYDLLKAAMRQRPEYIVVGEIRGIEAQTLFQAMSTGHAAYSTLHAGDVYQVIYRLESEPLNVPRSLIQFLDIVVVQTQWTKESVRRRRAKAIYEFLGIDPNEKELLINEFVRWSSYDDAYYLINPSKKLEKIAMIRGESYDEVQEELKRRAEFLKFLDKNNVRDYIKLTHMFQAYYLNPGQPFEMIYREVEAHDTDAGQAIQL